MNLFYQPLIPEGIHHLDGDESRHCIKVLRKSVGDSIKITDGNGIFYDAIIAKPDSSKCLFEITHQESEAPRNYSIHIAISPTKNADRIEWFIEKVVEIGIDKITLLDCKNTERSFLKLERLQKVAVSAMKQSLKATLPSIKGSTPFNTLLTAEEKAKFIAFVDYENPHHLKDVASSRESYLVLIGPEGDFAPEELEAAMKHGFKKVSLGKSRLRTETAGIAACHILNLINS